MEINSLASGISVLQNAQQKAQQSASQIATATTSQGTTSDLVKPLVELKVAEQQAQAGVKIIEAEGKAVGTILDLLV
ncbi:MAG: hypothetical protein ACI9IA_002501 [Enterobacterales bacterium]|jgi:hypothetical protein